MNQASNEPTSLGTAPRGFAGVIVSFDHLADSALSSTELESRLLELGFVEGATVEVLHEGPVGGDPIAIRINGATIALRRREAMAVRVLSKRTAS